MCARQVTIPCQIATTRTAPTKRKTPIAVTASGQVGDSAMNVSGVITRSFGLQTMQFIVARERAFHIGLAGALFVHLEGC
jgi:hypothetical protein